MILYAIELHALMWILYAANRLIKPYAQSSNPAIGLPAAFVFGLFGFVSSTAFYVSIIMFCVGLAMALLGGKW